MVEDGNESGGGELPWPVQLRRVEHHLEAAAPYRRLIDPRDDPLSGATRDGHVPEPVPRAAVAYTERCARQVAGGDGVMTEDQLADSSAPLRRGASIAESEIVAAADAWRSEAPHLSLHGRQLIRYRCEGPGDLIHGLCHGPHAQVIPGVVPDLDVT